jgi:signal peptidase II
VKVITRIATVGAILFGCVGCDQVSKGAVRLHLALGESHSFAHDTFRLVHTENPGAFLSLGETLPEHARVVIFTWAVGVLSVSALLAALLAPRLGPWRVVSLGLIAAGGLGNWIDRITNGGHVTDFLNFGVGSLRTGIFNIADLALTAGVALFVLAGQSAASNIRLSGPHHR